MISVNLWYAVGSSQDPPGRNGFAHLFEHMMFQGSKHVPEDAYVRFLEQAGATDRNAATGDDYTKYFETVPSNELELALWLESDRMAFLLDHLDQKTFENQRNVVKNERRQSYEDRPYGFCVKILSEQIFPLAHPYHRITIGEASDLDSASLQEARAFFQTWYVPNNATIVISGDVDSNAAFALVDKYFGPVVARPLPPRPALPPVRLERETRVEVAANVELPAVYMAWPTPAFFGEGDSDLDLLAVILAGGESSRLYRRLVHDLAIAQSVSASQGSRKLASMFVIDAKARPGHSADELLKIIDEELARIVDGGITKEELDRARNQALTSNVFGLERGLSRADRINLYVLNTGDPTYLAKDLARYQSATVDSVRRAAIAYLPLARRVVQRVTPNRRAPFAGAIVGKTEARARP
jgi:predicted Zn-dependent peptidase